MRRIQIFNEITAGYKAQQHIYRSGLVTLVCLVCDFKVNILETMTIPDREQQSEEVKMQGRHFKDIFNDIHYPHFLL